MTKVKNVIRLLQNATLALGQVDAPCTPEKIPAWIDAIPFLQIRLADDACRTYASTLQWPPVAADVRAQIHLRLSLAERVAGSVLQRRLPKMPGCDSLEFLLIDLWHNWPHV